MDPFLKIAYAQSKPLQKVAFYPSNDHEWLEKFKDTPLLDQAIALEQSDIQNEIAEKQQNMQTSEQQRSFWNNRDQIQLQKRMLELQLVQTQATGGAPPMTEPSIGPDAAAMTGGAGGDSPGTPETSMKTSSVKIAEYSFLCADAIGREMAKMAFGMNELKGLGGSAIDWAKKNPTKAMSAAGGVGGAAYGAATAHGQNGQGPTMGQRLGRAAGFGAAGAGAGAAAGQGVRVGQRMAGGETLGRALGGQLQSGYDAVVPRLAGSGMGARGNAMATEAQNAITNVASHPSLQFGQNLNLRASAGRARQAVSQAVDNAQLAHIDSGWG